MYNHASLFFVKQNSFSEHAAEMTASQERKWKAVLYFWINLEIYICYNYVPNYYYAVY